LVSAAELKEDGAAAKSLQSLGDVSKSYGKCLDGAVWVLEVQRVRVVINAAELHHLTSTVS